MSLWSGVCLWLLVSSHVVHWALPASLRHPHTAHASPSLSIPVLSISLTADPHEYLLRLLRSVDLQVDVLHITYGSSNSTATKQIAAMVNTGRRELLSKFPHTMVRARPRLVSPSSPCAAVCSRVQPCAAVLTSPLSLTDNSQRNILQPRLRGWV